MPELVLATQNPGKIAELQDLLAPLGWTVLGLTDVFPPGNLPEEPEETGSTFVQNATIKARAYAAHTGKLCLADDSGLIVDALNGAPGVISSHYAFEGQTEGPAAQLTRQQRDQANTTKLLADLETVPFEHRDAKFVCTMVLASPFPGRDTSIPGGAGFQPALPLPNRATYDGKFKATRRRLPHWQQAHATYFITFRLHSGRLVPPEREIVLNACAHWHGTRIDLDQAVVMPDHVHLIARPLQQPNGSWPELAAIIHSIKSFTANRINELRQTAGQLWQREYFDRIFRNEAELFEKRQYMWENPIRAALCDRPEEYPSHWIGRLEAGPTRVLASVNGTFEGRIGLPTDVPRGDAGFGYDPVFLVPDDYTRTSAELTKDEKNARSHRAHAVRAMIDYLRAIA